MKKTTYTYFGQVGLSLILGFGGIFLALSTLIFWNNLSKTDKSYWLYGGPFLIFGMFIIWRRLLIYLNTIKYDHDRLVVTNFWTKKSKIIEANSIHTFKLRNSNIFMTLNDDKSKELLKIYTPFYKDWKSILSFYNLNEINN